MLHKYITNNISIQSLGHIVVADSSQEGVSTWPAVASNQVLNPLIPSSLVGSRLEDVSHGNTEHPCPGQVLLCLQGLQEIPDGGVLA